MPPAFVLSQDQTLRKIKLFYRKIRFKALKYLRLEINFVLLWIFKVYIALFNFQSARSHSASDRNIIYHGFLFLQIVFWNFFRFFFKNRKFFKKARCKKRIQCYISSAALSHSTRNRKHNISAFFVFANHFWKNFADFCDFFGFFWRNPGGSGQNSGEWRG